MKSEQGCHSYDTMTLFEAGFALAEGREVPGGSQPYSPQISDCGPEGFTVTWKVGSSAVRAELPNVAEFDPEDVMLIPRTPVNGSTVSVRVNLAEHGYRKGLYMAQAYVYNAAGDVMISTVKVLVPENCREVGDWKLKPGLYTQSDGTYCILENGSAGILWQELEDGVYYFGQQSGKMYCGWINSGNTRYYLGPDGRMINGWFEENGKHYYFRSSGDMATGCLRLGNDIYYFDENGILTGSSNIPQL